MTYFHQHSQQKSGNEYATWGRMGAIATASIVTKPGLNKTFISRITYQVTTLFAQDMCYLNLHIVCKN